MGFRHNDSFRRHPELGRSSSDLSWVSRLAKRIATAYTDFGVCYSIYLSTDSPQDLAALELPRIRFEKELGSQDIELIPLLSHPNCWFLTSEHGGCSCHFRHGFFQEPPRFEPPQDWSPEDEGDVERTKEVYDFISGLVRDRFQVEVLDLWTGMEASDVTAMDVSLNQVSREEFQFCAGYLYRFRAD